MIDKLAGMQRVIFSGGEPWVYKHFWTARAQTAERRGTRGQETARRSAGALTYHRAEKRPVHTRPTKTMRTSSA